MGYNWKELEGRKVVGQLSSDLMLSCVAPEPWMQRPSLQRSKAWRTLKHSRLELEGTAWCFLSDPCPVCDFVWTVSIVGFPVGPGTQWVPNKYWMTRWINEQPLQEEAELTLPQVTCSVWAPECVSIPSPNMDPLTGAHDNSCPSAPHLSPRGLTRWLTVGQLGAGCSHTVILEVEW